MGKVVLIGAGPGAADLITVRGARVLALADVVLHDALVSADMLELCPQAIKILVGKRNGKQSTHQNDINQLLIEYAQKYALVVRLKGGDPMLFGRADEELAALELAHIPVEIIPGISTAFAAAATTQQPLTKRGIARSVAFFTSSSAPNLPATTQLPDCDTLVQYMGGQKAIETAQILLNQGRPASLPVVIVENCSLQNERIQRMTLNDLANGLARSEGPVLVMLGEAFKARD